MKTGFAFIFISLLSLTEILWAQARPRPEFRNQVLAGYQGWFSADGDGSLNRWSHWGPGAVQAGRVTFELFPDLREYHPLDLFTTSLGHFPNGQPVKLFASDRDGVVALHFKWMKQYGIDGVALQRFVNEISDPGLRAWRNNVTQKVRKYAEYYQKTFYLTYDISGASEATLVEDIQRDWVSQMEGHIRSPMYARQNGRAVIGLWGFGVEGRPGRVDQAKKLIRWFQSRGIYVVGGVPWHWVKEKKWLDTYFLFNMVQPWSVGSYASDSDIEHHFRNFMAPEKELLRAKGIDYQRVIFPGFAWSNWNGGARNMIPRRGGQFLWTQAYWASFLKSGAFIAMFDEYDEGTAIAKAAEARWMAPQDQYFLTLDADGIQVSSDFYLRLSGAATQMIQGRTPRTRAVPIPYK